MSGSISSSSKPAEKEESAPIITSDTTHSTPALIDAIAHDSPGNAQSAPEPAAVSREDAHLNSSNPGSFVVGGGSNLEQLQTSAAEGVGPHAGSLPSSVGDSAGTAAVSTNAHTKHIIGGGTKMDYARVQRVT